VESKLGPLGTSVTYWPIVPAPGDYEDEEFGGMKGRGNRSTRRKPAPTTLCPPQIPLDQTRDWTRAAAVGSQRLSASAMARPKFFTLPGLELPLPLVVQPVASRYTDWGIPAPNNELSHAGTVFCAVARRQKRGFDAGRHYHLMLKSENVYGHGEVDGAITEGHLAPPHKYLGTGTTAITSCRRKKHQMSTDHRLKHTWLQIDKKMNSGE
jgi:hypothetical protein